MNTSDEGGLRLYSLKQMVVVAAITSVVGYFVGCNTWSTSSKPIGIGKDLDAIGITGTVFADTIIVNQLWDPGEPVVTNQAVRLVEDTNDNCHFDSGTDVVKGTFMSDAVTGLYTVTSPVAAPKCYFVTINNLPGTYGTSRRVCLNGSAGTINRLDMPK